jgi:hypothetical protein
MPLHGLTSLTADMSGEGIFDDKPELISRPLKTMVRWNDTMLPLPLVADGATQVVQHTDGSVTARLMLSAAKPSVYGKVHVLWSFLLRPDARYVEFEANGTAVGGADAVFHEVDFAPKSITCVFEDGISQMMDKMWGNYLPTSKRLLTAYSLGPAGKGCLEVFPQTHSQANDFFAASNPSDSGDALYCLTPCLFSCSVAALHLQTHAPRRRARDYAWQSHGPEGCVGRT